MEEVIKRISKINFAKRWDYRFHQRKFSDLEQKLDASAYPLYFVNQITDQVIDGTHFTPQYTDNSGVLFLMTRNVRPHEITLNDVSYITHEEHQKLIRCKPEPGDVLVTKDGTIGIAAVVPDTLPEFNIFVSLIKIRPKPVISPHYLAAFINSELGQLQIKQQIKGAAITHIHLEDMRRIRVPVPPRSLQDQIAQLMQEAYGDRQKKLVEAQQLLNSIDDFILEALDIKFDNLNHEKRFVLASRELAKNRFDVDFHLPETHDKYEALKHSRKCRVTSLGTLIEQIANGATPKGANYLNEGIPFFRIQNIVPDGLDLSDVAYISGQTHNEMKRSQTRPGDLLMTITGRVGTAAVIPNSIEEGNINQHIVIIRLKPNAINTSYLATVINSSAVSFQANHRTTGTTRIALDYTAIKSLLIPVPTIEIQEQILGEVAHRRREAKRLQNEAEAVVSAAKARVERMILGEETLE